MAGVNKVILIGYLGQDPEVRYTQNGVPVANFSIATSEQWKDRDGVKQEHTEWHRIVAWNRLAEICGEYLHKGSQVYIEGKLQTRSWDDRDGNKRYATEIVAQSMTMLGSPRGDGNQSPPAQDTGKTGRRTPPAYDDGTYPPDDDIPF